MAGSNKYHEVNSTTAGILKAHQLLTERAIVLAESFQEGDREVPIKIQNILVQLQTSLDIRFQVSRDIHEVLAKLWDVVDSEDLDGILGVAEVLRTHLSTLKSLQGIHEK